ncbi:MAG: transcription termination factor Rho [Eubacteriales bacterium]|nr:transcription termination factor Rho [Eubacteriales bacterium]
MASKFEGKTKADLVTIARVSGLLKTTVSQRMSKAELLEFLEEADRNNSLALDETLPSKGRVKVKKLPDAEKERGAGRSALPESKASRQLEKLAESAKYNEMAKVGQVQVAENYVKESEEDRTESTEIPEETGEKTRSMRGKKIERNPRAGKRVKKHVPGQSKHARAKNEKNASEAEENNLNEDSDIEVANAAEDKKLQSGILEIMPDGYGFIRIENYIQGPNDLYLPPQYVKRFKLRTGDYVTGPCRQQRDQDRYPALYYLKEVNGRNPDEMVHRPSFDRLTPIYPNERFVLETSRHEISARIIDLVSPIGKGQRGMIVSPPKAGKTVLLKKIANAITENNPEVKLLVLLIDERPEEVTDMQRSIQGEVIYSTFDKSPDNHVKITELVLERAKRLVEMGEDVVILLDSITRMGRAYNLTINPTGRTLSGGLDPGALYGPKRFFGAARNIEQGGSLTIIATALVDTGSRMDEVIFEEFKGTGNMEVYLDRKLAEKRIFPAIDMIRSGTRREELLLTKDELDAIWGIRKAFGHLETTTVTESLISLMLKTRDNAQFVASINVSLNDKKLFEAMRATMGAASKSNSSSGNSNGSGNTFR